MKGNVEEVVALTGVDRGTCKVSCPLGGVVGVVGADCMTGQLQLLVATRVASSIPTRSGKIKWARGQISFTCLDSGPGHHVHLTRPHGVE